MLVPQFFQEHSMFLLAGCVYLSLGTTSILSLGAGLYKLIITHLARRVHTLINWSCLDWHGMRGSVCRHFCLRFVGCWFISSIQNLASFLAEANSDSPVFHDQPVLRP
uniref:Putative secreted protein n=1 Tax=Anopheles darlingi TaxID=43151 RepID=A0A2M4DBI1_ANODA